MGKGDKKSKHGKIIIGSYGVSRPRIKRSSEKVIAELKAAAPKKDAAPKKEAAPKKAVAEKKPAAKKVAKKKED